MRCARNAAALFSWVVLAVTTMTSASADPLTLTCYPDRSEGPPERKRIAALASGVVQRTSHHSLEVKAGGKTLRFVDQAPYGDHMEGDWTTFCDRKSGFILLFHGDGDAFAGKLIDEATGAVLPGNNTIVFSQDRRAYFAEGASGGDAADWYIYAMNGRLSWKGPSYIPEPDESSRMYATLANPQWDARGQFSAQATCFRHDAITWRATLIKNKSKWSWSPVRTCPK